MKFLRYFSKMQNNITRSYEDAIEALNTLQSNANYLKVVYNQQLSHTEEYSRTILQTKKYLLRSGITSEILDKLSVIHVTGTKGKGCTCACCESILRHHGYKTGFYSSPHLLEVRERIRINGEPISRNKFTKHFWDVYDKLDNNKNDVSDMPLYFRFLTVLAFDIFLQEKIDVAIVEVGIGGEYDCTNVLRKVPVVGITSLGIDHVNILGNSIQKIAWNKAGIMKEGCKAFTVSQPDEAMKMLQERSHERKCTLEVISENLVDVQTNGKSNAPHVLNINTSLAVALSHSWMSLQGKHMHINDFIRSHLTQLGIASFVWPGRYQVIHSDSITFYLDGAHTPESIDVCVNWFKNVTRNSPRSKALFFNKTGDRDAQTLLNILQLCNFDKVYFLPNVSGLKKTADNMDYSKPENGQMDVCESNRKIWLELCKHYKKHVNCDDIVVSNSVCDALDRLNNNHYDLLVTGSLYLIGSVLSVIDPELKGSQNSVKLFTKAVNIVK